MHVTIQLSTSPKQELALTIFRQYYNDNSFKQPLHMIIQGTIGTRKSYLIHCIKRELCILASNKKNPLLVVTATGIATFNIHASTIHVALKIPIREMQPLKGQSLLIFQEDMRHIKYLLVDEMSFIGPKILLKIDTRLHEAFPHQQQLCFGGISIILVGNLAQLPPVMDKPIYASHSNARLLWEQFNTIVTL